MAIYFFYSPARDVMDFLNIQDGGWLVSLSFNISETKHVIKTLTTAIIVIFKALIDNSKGKYIAIDPFKMCRFPTSQQLLCNIAFC